MLLTRAFQLSLFVYCSLRLSNAKCDRLYPSSGITILIQGHSHPVNYAVSRPSTYIQKEKHDAVVCLLPTSYLNSLYHIQYFLSDGVELASPAMVVKCAFLANRFSTNVQNTQIDIVKIAPAFQ